MLKLLITNGRMSGYMSELKENQERRAAAVHKQMMGNLVGQFVEKTLLSHEESCQSPLELKEPYISFSFTVDADAGFYESKRQALKSLVDARNDLIHHLLPRFNPDSIDSCLEIEQYLDQQRERLIPEYDFLKSLIEDFEEAKKIHADFLNSEEGIKQFELSCLQQSPIVALLLNISTQQPRSDGWTLLHVADPQIRRILPGEIEQLKHKWGYKTLKELMLASELFEILEEPTEKGVIRVLYRSKPELAYSAYSRLLSSLLDTSNREARADGWTFLSIANQQIEQTLANDFTLVKEKYGCKSLKGLMLESGLFDFFEELTDKDTSCELYKTKTVA